MAAPIAQLLVQDPDLADGLSGTRLHRAVRDLIADTLIVFEGPWDPQLEGTSVRRGLGLLVLKGMIVRRVGAPGRYGAELLGPGDLLRPWHHDGEDAPLPRETQFRVLEHGELAVLDVRFAARLAPYPEVVGALVGRAMQRSRSLAVGMAIAHHPRIDQRLIMLMWHLAERWGRVTTAGVLLPLPLTHELLADLVAARRPSVTSGLARLAQRGRISSVANGWLLHGEPPSEELSMLPATCESG